MWKILCFLLISIGLGCGSDESIDTNLAPRVITFEAESDIVDPGGEVQIVLVAGDLENDVLSYTWSVTGGELTENASGALLASP